MHSPPPTMIKNVIKMFFKVMSGTWPVLVCVLYGFKVYYLFSGAGDWAQDLVLSRCSWDLETILMQPWVEEGGPSFGLGPGLWPRYSGFSSPEPRQPSQVKATDCGSKPGPARWLSRYKWLQEKPGDLNLILRTHVEGENQFLKHMSAHMSLGTDF